ncbi:ABC transporter permease [Algoriphagus sp. oki45]|uniref:ABC transporter permease n=1 Tax=Algoriphagus sp. oki45 TaxID=3067294 RepID=UPI0027F6D63D|nr:ABC transporter permease [Algoriphagus sp. oki45]
MLKNYFKIAWRNLLRNKVRTGIHILGLSLGIAICFLIFNIVWYAYSFDNFHPDGDRIYRIVTENDHGEMKYSYPAAPGPLGDVLSQELSGVEVAGKLYTIPNTHASLPALQKNFGRKDYITFADPGFFRLFQRKWLAGNPNTALTAPNQVIISQKSAETYFPGESLDGILGKEILYVDTDSIFTTIVGVVEDYKENSDFIFQDFISYSTIKENEKEDWYGVHSWTNINSSNQLFFKTQSNYRLEEIQSGLDKITQKYYADEEDGKTTFGFESLSELHFSYPFDNEGASKTLIQGLLIIGGIILILACLNFINLETAQAIGRAKEVGIRKTLGGGKNQLVFQFLSETHLMVLFASLVGLIFSDLILKAFQSYLPEGFTITYFSAVNLAFLIVFSLVLTLVSGIYPALILANYQPQRALKGEKQGSGKFSFGVFLRKNLTVLQFTASMVFLVMVMVISSQMKYVSSQPVGFEKDAVVYAHLPFMAGIEKASLFRERSSQMSFVEGASLGGDAISSAGIWTYDVRVPIDSAEVEFFTQVKNVDSSFVQVNGVTLLAGRNLRQNPNEVLVNEQFLRDAGYKSPQEALGSSIAFRQESSIIVGVMKDFNSRSLKEEIMPMIFFQAPDYYNVISIKLGKGINLSNGLTSLKEAFSEVYPYEEIDFKFLDEEIERFYEEDLRIRNILGFASVIAMLISGMGLFGLSSFTISQRMKEISLRKILGASVTQILALISRDYLVLILISIGLAAFPTYWLAKTFLQSYTYRIDMPYLQFGLGGLALLSLCLMIVGIHSYLAAQTNPAQVLKDE